MGQCIAKTKSGRRCFKLAEKGKRLCAIHRDHTDWKRIAATVAGGGVGIALAPTIIGGAAGAFVGNLVDRYLEEKKTVAKRVFVSFDFDKDKTLKDFLVGQSKKPDSPFTIADWSLKEAQKEREWKAKARAQIKRCNIVVVIAGTQTYRAPGVLAEVEMAREEGVRIVQIKGYQNQTCPRVPNAGTLYKWTWDNLKELMK